MHTSKGHLIAICILTLLLLLVYSRRPGLTLHAILRWWASPPTTRLLAGEAGIIVHHAVWWLAMLNAWRSYKYLMYSQREKDPRLLHVWILFGIFSAIQQWFVLRDFQHMVGSAKALQADYGQWINMRV